MCCGGSSRCLSRLGSTAGLLSLVTLVTALVTNAWLYTREPVSLPNSQATTTITFRIGFWRACPALKRVMASPNTLLPSPGCQLIKYSRWLEVKETDLGVFWSTLEYTPTFVTKIRYAMPLVALAAGLLLLATLFAMLGHCRSDYKTLVACGLFTLAGLTLAGGLVVFVSAVSEVGTAPRLDYRYGWSFQAAGTAFVLTEVAALVSISAYVRRFASAEQMVRAVVPGADRRLWRPEGLLQTPPDLCAKEEPDPAPFPSRHSCATVPRPPSRRPRRDLPPHPRHPATLVLPEHEPYRYTTIIHQGLLGVAEGTSSSSASSSSSRSLPRTRPRGSPSSASLGYCSAVT